MRDNKNYVDTNMIRKIIISVVLAIASALTQIKKIDLLKTYCS